MDAETISDILQCRITTWDHSNISRLNPGFRYVFQGLVPIALQMFSESNSGLAAVTDYNNVTGCNPQRAMRAMHLQAASAADQRHHRPSQPGGGAHAGQISEPDGVPVGAGQRVHPAVAVLCPPAEQPVRGPEPVPAV